jgi:hypothetical protein
MYDKDRDFITIDGTDFSGILDGDGAFTTSRSGDSVITRVDSSGKLITFKASDNTITGSITVRPDAKTALKKLRQLMNTYKSFKISRDNRNTGGEKETYVNCYMVNDGENGKNSSGEKNARTFNFICENKLAEEGAY